MTRLLTSALAEGSGDARVPWGLPNLLFTRNAFETLAVGSVYSVKEVAEVGPAAAAAAATTAATAATAASAAAVAAAASRHCCSCASPRQAFVGLLVQLCSDTEFRRYAGFATVALYPVLYRLCELGIGPEEESPFVITVQLFTTPSLARALVLEADVLSMLLTCLLSHMGNEGVHAASDGGSGFVGPPVLTGAALNLGAKSLVHHRYRVLFRDLAFVLRNPGVGAALAVPPFLPLRQWMRVRAVC